MARLVISMIDWAKVVLMQLRGVPHRNGVAHPDQLILNKPANLNPILPFQVDVINT